MKRKCLIILSLAALFSGCTKEVEQYTVSLEARCYDCIVTYAAGPARGRVDTIFGSINGSDTLTATGAYFVIAKADDNLFFRACRIYPDTSFGPIELRAFGPIQEINTSVSRAEDCAAINQVVVVQ